MIENVREKKRDKERDRLANRNWVNGKEKGIKW